jgi:hypothetical protein
MKIKHIALPHLLLALAFTLLLSCKKQADTSQNPLPDTDTGEVVAVGVPDSSAKAQKIIGIGGGTLQSKDGLLTIDIPPGAIKENQNISIQRISNTNPLGKTKAYRIEPHGVQFAQAVKLTFKSADHLALKTSGIAYQDTKGVWQAVGGASLNGEKNSISVSTNHFSDWTLFDCLFVIPPTGTVQPGLSLKLEVFTDDELLAPLVVGEERPIGKPQKIADKYIKKWELVGPGSLSTQGATAEYHAPDDVPDTDHATVNIELDLGDKGKYILVVPIEITYSAVRVTLNDQPEFIYKSASAVINGDQVVITASNGSGVKVLINWQGDLGFHPFATSVYTQFGFFPNDQDRYVHFYTVPETHKDVPSEGGITVTDMGQLDGFVKGTFEVKPIGKVGDTRVIPSGKLSGSFKVKRMKSPY